jgi:hypothetical protein
MKVRWQPFLFICGVVVALSGMVASCGPERPFCPYGPDPEYICVPADEGGVGGGGGTGPIGMCDGGAQFICGGIVQCTPCGA